MEYFEEYEIRQTTRLANWQLKDMDFKVYGVCVEGSYISDQMLETAKTVLENEAVARIDELGGSDKLGFIIVHSGALGLTIGIYWWTQGSVLCQHVYRKEYSLNITLDTITRPVIACVWELEIIGFEQVCWRKTMMCKNPSPKSYLDAFFEISS